MPNVSTIGTINIQPCIGQTVPAKLAVLDVAKFDSDVVGDEANNANGPLHMVFAVTDLASFDVILPVTVVNELKNTSHMSTEFCTDNHMLQKCIVTSLQRVANESTVDAVNQLSTNNVSNVEDELID